MVNAGDVDTHADLAVAYREMGLFAGAIVEAAVALEHGTANHTAHICRAVCVTLNS